MALAQTKQQAQRSAEQCLAWHVLYAYAYMHTSSRHLARPRLDTRCAPATDRIPSSRRQAPGPLDPLRPISRHLHASTSLRHDSVSSFSGFPPCQPCLFPFRRQSATSHGRQPSPAHRLPHSAAIHLSIHSNHRCGCRCRLLLGYRRPRDEFHFWAPFSSIPLAPLLFPSPPARMRGCARVTKPGNQSIVWPALHYTRRELLLLAYAWV